jgi:2-hydroxychromene-2-carboxylate isomerase
MPQAALRQTASNEEAIASGCFGVPWFIAEGETFFGHDRVPHLLDFLTLRP